VSAKRHLKIAARFRNIRQSLVVVNLFETNFSSRPSYLEIRWAKEKYTITKSKLFSYGIVAPCLSDAPTNGSISGFSSGRVTTVRSSSGDALEIVAPIEAAISGVRSNATDYCLYAWCGCAVRMVTRR